MIGVVGEEDPLFAEGDEGDRLPAGEGERRSVTSAVVDDAEVFLAEMLLPVLILF